MGKALKVGLVMVLAAALLLGWAMLAAAQHQHGSSGAPAANHENHSATGAERGEARAAKCEICLKPLAAKSEVVLENAADGSQHHYRCIHCALVGANDWLKSDVILRARSKLRGEPVEWARRGGKWSVVPASAKVLAAPETDGECLDKHLVFADDAEFKAYGRLHSQAAGHSAMSATEVASILSSGKPPAPKQATCPVTGETVRPDAKTEWTVYKGQIYYFCCAECKPAFIANPEAFMKKGASSGSGSHHSMGGHCG